MAREFSAGGVLVRWRKGRWWMATIEPQGRTAAGPSKETLALPKGLIDPEKSRIKLPCVRFTKRRAPWEN